MDTDEKEQNPPGMLDQGEQKEHNRTYNIFGWIFQIAVWAGFITSSVLYVMDSKSLTPICVVSGVIYVIYLIIEFCSPTSRYLLNQKTDKGMYNTMGEIFKTPPEIKFHCECYHYTTVHYTTRDSKGNIQHHTKEEKVVTYRETYSLPYYSERDVSGLFYLNCDKAYVQKKHYIKLKLKEEINFADSISYYDYEKEKDAFWKRNRFRDTYFNFTENRIIPGMKHHNLVRLTKKKPEGVSFRYFAFFTFLGLTEIYRIWIDSLCVYQKFKVRKLVSTRYDLNKAKYHEFIPQLDVIVQQYTYQPEYYNYINQKYKAKLPTSSELEDAKKYQNEIPNYQVSNVGNHSKIGVVVDHPGYSNFDATKPPAAFASIAGDVALSENQVNPDGKLPTGFGQPSFQFNNTQNANANSQCSSSDQQQLLIQPSSPPPPPQQQQQQQQQQLLIQPSLPSPPPPQQQQQQQQQFIQYTFQPLSPQPYSPSSTQQPSTQQPSPQQPSPQPPYAPITPQQLSPQQLYVYAPVAPQSFSPQLAYAPQPQQFVLQQPYPQQYTVQQNYPTTSPPPSNQ